MIAVFLAAGRGSRMGAATATSPKALLGVGGETLLDRLARQCSNAGIRSGLVVTGHLAVQIEQHLSQGAHDIHWSFVRNPAFATSNNIASLRIALDELAVEQPDAPILLIECDVVLKDGVLDSIVRHRDANVALVSPHGPHMDGTVLRLEGDQVSEIITPQRQGAFFDFRDTFKTVNVYKMAPSLWRDKLRGLLDWYVDSIDDQAYYENAIGILTYATRGQMTALSTDPSSWREVDDQNDLRRANWSPPFGMGADDPRQAHGGLWGVDVLDFSYIRNMYFPPPDLIAHLRGRLEESLHNYGSSQDVLDGQMAWYLEAQPQETVALPGASMGLTCLAASLEDKRVLVPTPTFGEYSRLFPAARTYKSEGTTEQLRLGLEQWLPDVAFVVNPNNPTGHLFPSAELVSVAANHPTTMFVFDESFLPFTREPSVRELVPSDITNVTVIASLGKALGVPGLRLGYMWSRSRALIHEVRGGLPIWAMSSLAEMFMEGLLKFRPQIAASLVQTADDRHSFAVALGTIPGVECDEAGGGNFLVVHLRNSPRDRGTKIAARLLNAGFLTKDISERLETPHVTLRLAVRLPDENAALCTALKATLRT